MVMMMMVMMMMGRVGVGWGLQCCLEEVATFCVGGCENFTKLWGGVGRVGVVKICTKS